VEPGGMTTTFRQDTVSGLKAILDLFKDANPTLLQETFRVQPPSLIRPTPFGFIELRPEEVSHDSGTRTREMAPSIVVVDRWTENDEVMARIDAFVDMFMDHITRHAHIATGIVHGGRLTVEDTIEQEGEAYFVAVRFVYRDIVNSEGRDSILAGL
jgi:hypothetical protein